MKYILEISETSYKTLIVLYWDTLYFLERFYLWCLDLTLDNTAAHHTVLLRIRPDPVSLKLKAYLKFIMLSSTKFHFSQTVYTLSNPRT